MIIKSQWDSKKEEKEKEDMSIESGGRKEKKEKTDKNR